jgi:hypothetical protein
MPRIKENYARGLDFLLKVLKQFPDLLKIKRVMRREVRFISVVHSLLSLVLR